MKISVIIPCRNEARHIREFLDSLLMQELDPGWELEVLVADGMSDDGTLEILSEYGQRAPNVRVIPNPGRIVSTGLNAAIEASEGEVVIRMDAHTVYAKDYIRECVRALEESGADNVGGPWVAKGRGFIGLAIAAAFRLPFCSGGGKAHDPAYEGPVDTVYLGCWRRSVFGWAGMFDPNLVRNQDDEFNFRLRRLGGQVWQSPRIKSHYAPRASLRALLRQYAQYGFWRVAVIRKHRALASWRHAVPALFVSSLLALSALGLLAGLLGHFTAAAVFASFIAAGLLAHFLAGMLASSPLIGALEPRTVLAIPVVIFVYHFGYGLGFLAGLAQRTPSGSEARPPSRFFTALTR